MAPITNLIQFAHKYPNPHLNINHKCSTSYPHSINNILNSAIHSISQLNQHMN